MKNVIYVTILVALLATGCSTLPAHVSECTTAECTAAVIAREDSKFRRMIEAEEDTRNAQLCWSLYRQWYNKTNGRCVGGY